MLLDTNATFLPFREGVPLAAEVDRLLPGAELVVPSSVLDELDRLVERGVPHASAARAFARTVRSIPVEGRGDRAVVVAAGRLRASVVTADEALTRALRSTGAAVLTPRDRAKLELRLPRFPVASPPAPARRRRATKR